MFINTKGTVGDVSEEFRELMHFIDTSEIREYKNELVNDLAQALVDARSRDEWRNDYMSIEMLKNECRAEGRAEGEMKGRMETARENAINMLKEGLGIHLTSKCSGLPLEEVQALAAAL